VVLLDEDLPRVDGLTGSRGRTHRILEQLEREGRLRQVKRGAYVLVTATGVIETGLLDLVAAITPKPHLVTAGKALQFHDLTDQHFRRAMVLVPRQLRPWSWRGEEVRYARTTPRRLRGGARTRRSKARIATPERAIVDSLDHPGWGVTLSQVVEALDTALRRYPDFASSLAVTVAEYGSHALARRIGFLVSRLAGPEKAKSLIALRGRTKAVTPLLKGGPEQGSVDPTWQVRENVDFDRLVAHRQVI
jgi:predicted transcriptional regulator of viral defense system